MEDDGCTLDDLTVLARGNDPFRQDTTEATGSSVAPRHLEAMGFEVARAAVVHNRGLHYLLIGQARPTAGCTENDEST